MTAGIAFKLFLHHYSISCHRIVEQICKFFCFHHLKIRQTKRVLRAMDLESLHIPKEEQNVFRFRKGDWRQRNQQYLRQLIGRRGTI